MQKARIPRSLHGGKPHADQERSSQTYVSEKLTSIVFTPLYYISWPTCYCSLRQLTHSITLACSDTQVMSAAAGGGDGAAQGLSLPAEHASLTLIPPELSQHLCIRPSNVNMLSQY